MIHQQQEPGDGGKLKGDAPVCVFILAVFDLVVDEHGGCCNHIGQYGAADIAQGILVEETPWRVGCSEEYGLQNDQLAVRWPRIQFIAIVGEEGVT